MEINIEVSEIINDDYSEFIDSNSQLYINEESFVATQQIQLANLINLPQDNNNTNSTKQTLPQEQLQVQVPPPQNVPVVPVQQQWQKVSFAKKRIEPSVISSQNIQVLSDTNQTANSSNKQAKSLTSKILERTRTTVQQKQEDPIQMVQQKVQKVEKHIGPLPVFDCLFCCQEHFVLFKTNELSLINKYCRYYMDDFKMLLPILDMALNEINKVQYHSTSPKQNKQQFKIESIESNLVTLQNITKNITKYDKPKIKKSLKFKKTNIPLQPKVVIEQKPQQQNNLCDILGQSMNESHFCVNLRTRRQKILQNISFESETHNIYDPYFTSEEELSDSESEQSSNLSENSISSIEQEDDELSSVEDERNDEDQQKQILQVKQNEEDEDEGSERLTFGCITPQEDEDQKVTFSNYGEEPSLSPVRSNNKNMTQEEDCNSPSHLKNALLLDHSPMSVQAVQHINFYPKECESDIPPHQQSYDTDLKIGHILSQISRPTEESKEPSTPSSSSSCENSPKVNILQQLAYQPQSHSFNNHYKHQKLINTNHIVSIQNKDKITEMLKRTQLLKEKQFKHFNTQHFMSFDQINTTTQDQRNTHIAANNSMPIETIRSQQATCQHENKTFDEIIVSSRQAACSTNRIGATQDFTQMIDLSKLKTNLAKMAYNPSGSKSVQAKKDSSMKKVHAHQGSIVPKLLLNSQECVQKGRLMISQRELNQLRSALCSSRYSTQAQMALNALSSYNLEEESCKVKKLKKKQVKKSQKSKQSGSKKTKSRKEELSKKKADTLVPPPSQPEWYHPITQQTMPMQFYPQQQQTTKNSMYMSIQDGKTFLNLPQSQHDTLNTEASSMMPNSLSKISYKRRPEKLNGSIEEVQNFLNSIEIKSNNGGCGSKKGSISLSRAGCKQSSNSITRQPNETNHPTQGQFSFSQNSVKLNLTANISNNFHKKKKSKLPPHTIINQVNTTSSSSTIKSHQFMKQKQRTRSSSKQSNGMLLTQQMSDKKHLKSNKKINAESSKQKKKDTEKSHSHISSRKQLLINHNKPSYGTSLFMLSQATSPLKVQNHLNFSSGMMRISQNHIPLQPSMSVKESIDLKKSLAKEYYEYLNLQKKQ